MWLMYDNMRNQWLMLAACFWVLFMLMVASRFIPLTFKDHDSYVIKPRVMTWTAATEVQRLPIQEEFKRLQVIHQSTYLWSHSCNRARGSLDYSSPICCSLPHDFLEVFLHELGGFVITFVHAKDKMTLPVDPPTSLVSAAGTVNQGHYIFNNGQQPTGKGLEDDLRKSQVQMDRLELLRNVCRNASLKNLTHTTISKFVLDRIFVSDKHRILFCQTPKVGNTQWKKVLIILNGLFPSIDAIPEHIVHDHEKNGIPRLSSFKEWEIEERLNSYFKFFIVRDPFERLISAFKDKFVRNPRFEPWYKHNIAPAIIRKYRKNQTETRGLQFQDFVRYLGDPKHRRLDLQFGEHIIHWVTYVELCAPCEINYSVVGHHETLEDDVAHILKGAGIDHLVSYPAIPPGITLYNRTKVQSYFSSVAKRDIRRLYERFKGDFKLFGYPEPDFLHL